MPAPKNDTWLATALDWLEASEFAVALFVNGMVVSGTVVSAADYYRGLGEQLAEAANRFGGGGDGYRAMFGSLADQSLQAGATASQRLIALLTEAPPVADRTRGQDEEVERLLRNYIHLRDVVAVAGGGARLTVRFWRGRLSEVTGWSFGRADTDNAG